MIIQRQTKAHYLNRMSWKVFLCNISITDSSLDVYTVWTYQKSFLDVTQNFLKVRKMSKEMQKNLHRFMNSKLSKADIHLKKNIITVHLQRVLLTNLTSSRNNNLQHVKLISQYVFQDVMESCAILPYPSNLKRASSLISYCWIIRRFFRPK